MKEIDKWLPYLYWLDRIPNMGRSINHRLMDAYTSPIRIFHMEETEIRNWLHANQIPFFQKAQKKEEEDLIKEYEMLQDKKIRFLPFYHPDYPDKLRRIADAPFAVYVRGELPENTRPTVAMIGTRKCSEYGSCVARYFAKEFAKYGCQVVSGMASGIDGISQRTVLEQGGKTFAILGSGVDICYPKENYDIFKKIPEQGGIISEYCPGTVPIAGQFPPRNRIISALSDVVLVVEAQEKSGTLITVDMALEQGKEVYAIPGRCTDKSSRGCNLLIKQGAGMAISPGDILKEAFDIEEQTKDFVDKSRKQETKKVNLSPIGSQICEVMSQDAETIDEIYHHFLEKYPQKICSITDFMCEIMDLQIKGYIGRIGGKYQLMVQ